MHSKHNEKSRQTLISKHDILNSMRSMQWCSRSIFQRLFFWIFIPVFTFFTQKKFLESWKFTESSLRFWPYYSFVGKKSAQFNVGIIFFLFHCTKFNSNFTTTPSYNGVWRKTEKSLMIFVLLYNLFLLRFFFISSFTLKEQKSKCEFETKESDERTREAVEINLSYRERFMV
jgi:hypothetical protein